MFGYSTDTNNVTGANSLGKESGIDGMDMDSINNITPPSHDVTSSQCKCSKFLIT